MKANKMLFLLPGVAALFLSAASIVPSFTHAVMAASPQAGRWEKKADALNLTDAQKAQMKQINESTRQQIDAVLTAEQKAQIQTARQQKQRPNLNLSEDQKAKMKAIRQNAKAQMDALLTPEQKQKLQTLRQEHKQRHQQQQQQQQ